MVPAGVTEADLDPKTYCLSPGLDTAETAANGCVNARLAANGEECLGGASTSFSLTFDAGGFVERGLLRGDEGRVRTECDVCILRLLGGVVLFIL